jgi:hypothetical protein
MKRAVLDSWVIVLASPLPAGTDDSSALLSATHLKSEGEERSQNRLSEMLSRTLIKLEAIHYNDERHSC